MTCETSPEHGETWNPEVPIHETTAAGVGEYSIQWAFDKEEDGGPHRVEWALFSVAADSDDEGPENSVYYHTTSGKMQDWTQDIGKAAPCVTGFVKWDGCTQWWMNDNPLHVDSRHEYHAFATAMIKARHRAMAIMREYGRHVDEPDQVVDMEVVCALVTGPNGTLLMQKRPDSKNRPGQWEWPGGKVERGEDPRAALVRELTEELGPEWEGAAVIGQVFQETMHLVGVMRLTGFAVALPKALAIKIAGMEGWIGSEEQEVEWVGVNRAIIERPCTYGTYRAYKDVLRWVQQRGRKS